MNLWSNRIGWKATEYINNNVWITRITNNMREDLENATEKLLKKIDENNNNNNDHIQDNENLNVKNLVEEDFPLSLETRKLFKKIEQEIVFGRGFHLFKGLPIKNNSNNNNKNTISKETAALYFGIGLYFGKAVSQNSKGHVLGHGIYIISYNILAKIKY